MKLPLSRHNLGVGTRNLDSSVQASLVVSLNDISAEDLTSTNATVVWALGTWETSYGPTIWSILHIKKGVLLLETEPRLVGFVGLHEFGTLMAVVELVWGSISVPALSYDQNVGGAAQWIGVDSNWSEVDIRIIAGGLASRTAVEVPFWKVVEGELTIGRDLGESLIE